MELLQYTVQLYYQKNVNQTTKSEHIFFNDGVKMVENH